MSTITPPRVPIADGSTGIIPGLASILSTLAGRRTRRISRQAREARVRHRTVWAPAGGGHRERARRVRQIRAGTLTASNGLVVTIADEGQP